MITEINRIKQNPIFKSENSFFKSQKYKFSQMLSEYLFKAHLCQYTIIEQKNIAENFYDALFDPDQDCYNMHLCWIEKYTVDTTIFICSLFSATIKDFIEYKKDMDYRKVSQLIDVFEVLKSNLFTAVSEQDKITFDVSPYLSKSANISYLQNIYKLGRDIKFIVHTKAGTSHSEASIKQIGHHSAVVVVTNEQLLLISQNCNSFILKEKSDEKNFSVTAKILHIEDNTVIIKDVKELESYPLLSRKFPRAAIIHASIIHIANEQEYITGNMLDISEGGIGIISSSKSHFEKGQDIVAFLSYEDEKNGFRFSIEATGIITSIIGKEHVFRYGIKLTLDDEEKKTIHKLVDVINNKKQQK